MARPLMRLHAITSKIGPNRGAATIDLSIPPVPALVGVHFSARWVVLDPSGRTLALTRTLRLPISQVP